MTKVTFEASEDVKDQIVRLIYKEACRLQEALENIADEGEWLNYLERAGDLHEVIRQIKGVK